MSAAPDFSKRPVPPPPVATPPAAPNFAKPPAAAKASPVFEQSGHGDKPLPRGKVFSSDSTTRQLRAVGWREGETVPPEFTKKFEQIQRELAEERLGSPVPENFQQTIAETVPIDQMPQDYQDELRKVLEEHRNDLAADAAVAATPSATDPSVARAIQSAAQAAAAGAQTPVSPESVGLPPPPPGHTLGGMEGINPAIAAMNAPRTSPPQPESPTLPEPDPGEKLSAGGAEKPHSCPRCEWVLSQTYEPERPTATDRQNYVAAILGMRRFTKDYSLFGGRVTVTMRSLTTLESEMIYTQLNYDMRAGRIEGEGDYFAQLGAYRMTATVAKISDGATTRAMTEVLKIPYTSPGLDAPPETVFAKAKPWFLENVLGHDTMHRVVAQVYRQFMRLMETLEGQASAENFWNGTGS